MNPERTIAPLTQLSEDENLFFSTVRKFAQEQIAPLTRRMDEDQHMDAGLIRGLFELGLMGIGIPEQYGGSGGTFFDSVLAVEAISAVDPAVGVLVDVQNTLVAAALMRWATEEQKKKYLSRLAANTVGAYALSEAGSGSDAFALQTRAELRADAYVLNGRKLFITNGAKPAFLSSLPPSTRPPDTRALPPSSPKKARRGSRLAAKRTSSAFAHRAPAS